MTHFVLVHGACHGGWCWYKLQTLLEAAGHMVTAVDEGASGINAKQVSDIHDIMDYLEPLLSFMEALPQPDEKVVLVGHSMGGLDVAVTMEKFPHKISVAVFLEPFMVGVDFTLEDLVKQDYPSVFMDSKVTFMDSKVTYDEDGHIVSILSGPQYLASLYRLSPPQDLTLAKSLERAYPYQADERAFPYTRFTKENYGSVPRVAIKAGDPSVDMDDVFIQNNPPDQVYHIPDSDHMSMISQPQQLSSILQEIASKYN